MKSIKICAANKDVIQAELLKVNGRAVDHTLTSLYALEAVIATQEKKLLKLVGAKKDMQGAKVDFISGDAVSSGYKYSRKATRIQLRRGAKEWFIDEIASTDIYQKGGMAVMYLTTAQNAAAIAHLQQSYLIQQ